MRSFRLSSLRPIEKYRAGLALVFFVFAHSTWAAVPALYRTVAAEYGIPPLLLYAIACVESTTPLADRTVKPWPWTLSINAAPYYYATQTEALAALHWARQRPVKQLGIGLMQIEWRYHRQRLPDLASALDPAFNLRTGAAILRTEYRNAGGDWDLAVKRYHSRTPHRQEGYVKRVNAVLRRLTR